MTSVVQIGLYGEYFAFAGCVLSFTAASIMLYLLLSDANARSQVRPRLLIVLAGLDMLAGLVYGLANLPIPDSPAIQNPFYFILLLGNAFEFGSFTWTCLVAFHVHNVIATGIEADSEEEFEWEKHYLAALFVLMGCIYLPLVLVFGLADRLGSAGFPGVLHLNLAFFVLQYLFILTITARVHLIDVQNAAARKYREQMRVFLVMFLLLTVCFLVVNIVGQISGSSTDSYAYFEAFPANLFTFMGFANALIWGLSASCMVRCINKCFDNPNQSSMELPLLSNKNSLPEQRRSTARSSATIEQLKAGEIRTDQLHFKELIGKGGFGAVYRAHYQGNIVAVKVVALNNFEKNPLGASACLGERRSSDEHGGSDSSATGKATVTRSSTTVQKALSEAQILTTLRHPNTVLFYGLSVKATNVHKLPPLARKHAAPIEAYYYVTELCEGGALNGVPLGVGRVAGTELWEMLAQVAAGCQYLHSKQIVHRDLKPGNILVSETKNDGVVQRTYKVCDFGVSKWLGDEGGEQVITGGVGTSLYMAPEVVTGNEPAMRAHPFACDVFSFGILAFHVLAGHRPYQRNAACVGKSPHQIKQLVAGGLRPLLPRHDPTTSTIVAGSSWPDGVEQLLEKCWCEEAGSRIVFSEIAQQLHTMKAPFALRDRSCGFSIHRHR